MDKQIKLTEDQRKKQIHAIMNQNKRLAVLTNKDYKNVPHKEIFAEIVKERFD